MKKTAAILLLAAVILSPITPIRQRHAHAQEGPTIPHLSDTQLLEIVSQPQYLPGSYRDTAKGSSHTTLMADSAADMRESWPLAGDRLEDISTRYGWEYFIGAEYDTCQPDRAISGINIDVSQLTSPEAARAFIDDVAVRAYFEALFYQTSDSTLVHGWVMNSLYTDEGVCFAEEDFYSLVFEHWGLLFSVDVRVQAGTDSALPVDMANQIALQIVQVVDTLYSSSFPATPMPNPAVESLTASLTLDNLERVLPTADDVTLPAGTYLPNQDVSRIFTLNDIVTSYRSLNLTALADALSEAGTTHGMLGQGVRLWEPIEDCPSIYGISIEIDVALFQNADGPTGYMADPFSSRPGSARGCSAASTRSRTDRCSFTARCPTITVAQPRSLNEWWHLTGCWSRLR